MNSQLHLLDFPKVNTHIHFVDDKSELLSSKEMVQESKIEDRINVPSVEEIVELIQEKKKAYKRLHSQLAKEKDYSNVLYALTMQKHLMVFDKIIF